MTPLKESVYLGELGTSRGDRLSRISEAGLVNEGRVFLLSLESIRVELGDRWLAREAAVWEALERALAKRMPAPDVFIRINATTVLAAIASTDAYDGQVRCAEVLGSVLTYFLGRSRDEDIGISRVSSLDDMALTAEPVDRVAPFKPILVAAKPLAEAKPPENWTPPLAGRRASTTFVSNRHGSSPSPRRSCRSGASIRAPSAPTPSCKNFPCVSTSLVTRTEKGPANRLSTSSCRSWRNINGKAAPLP